MVRLCSYIRPSDCIAPSCSSDVIRPASAGRSGVLSTAFFNVHVQAQKYHQMKERIAAMKKHGPPIPPRVPVRSEPMEPLALQIARPRAQEGSWSVGISATAQHHGFP